MGIKKFLALLSVVLLASVYIASAETIFFDGFESGSFGEWTESVEYDWNVETPAELNIPGYPSGNLVAHADNCDSGCYLTLKDAIDLSSYENVTVKFYRYVDNALDNGEYLKVEAYDGSSWNQIFYWTNGAGDDNTWHYETWNVPAGYLVSNFKIRYVTKESQTKEEVEVDDVKIEGTPSGEPDSCSDTDGGNVIATFGTTSGYYGGIPYSNDDYCVDASNVMEHYCSGDYEQSQQQSCGTDGYGSAYCSGDLVYKDYTDYWCALGECLDNATPVLQEDCDSYDSYGAPYCSNSSVYRDYSDYYCSGGSCSYTTYPEWVENCDYGCTNGTCDPVSDSCSDTDGGNVIATFGTTSGYYGGVPYSNDDYCVDVNNIMEHYCSGDYEQSQQQSCGTDGYGSAYCSADLVYKDYNDYFCSVGACSYNATPVLQEDCDSYDNYGSTYCFNSSVYKDYNDYYCSAGACNYTTYPEWVENCDYGCTNGTCDPVSDSCSDTDGG
ncbi:hypothetical protein KY366_02730, partial [Candidatus Woesearchaeota archaeon]|nr:hypothetical protein [Candidatus Woesearchaeota archaeon]